MRRDAWTLGIIVGVNDDIHSQYRINNYCLKRNSWLILLVIIAIKPRIKLNHHHHHIGNQKCRMNLSVLTFTHLLITYTLLIRVESDVRLIYVPKMYYSKHYSSQSYTFF